MSKKELFTGPYMPFFWDDFFAGVTDLLDDEIIAYQKLIWYQWRKGRIPISEHARLKKIIGKDGDEFSRIWGEIKGKFPHGKNAKVEKVRTYTNSRNVNKLGQGCTQEHTQVLTPEHTPKVTPLKISKSQSTKNPDSYNPKPPTIEEVTEHCKVHAKHVNPREFFLHYDSLGWKSSTGKDALKVWTRNAEQWNQNAVRKGEPIFSDAPNVHGKKRMNVASRHVDKPDGFPKKVAK